MIGIVAHLYSLVATPRPDATPLPTQVRRIDHEITVEYLAGTEVGHLIAEARPVSTMEVAVA